MDINKLESNSHKSKGEETPKTVLPIRDITVKTKKQSTIGKFAKSMIAEDAKSVGGYIFMDVLIPAVKKLIVDVIENGINALMYGQDAPVKRSSSSSTQKIAYNRAFTSSSLERTTRAAEIRNRSVYDFEDVIFENRGTAEMILEDLKDAVSKDRYGAVSVGDLRDACGLPTTNTDWKYGWTDLGSAEVMRTRDGDYIISFPRITKLD